MLFEELMIQAQTKVLKMSVEIALSREAAKQGSSDEQPLVFIDVA
jgi:hypothetical protein